MSEGELFFDTDSRLLSELGERLLPNRAVALAELVKNSYDADATHVKITLKNVKQKGGTIKVEDNGLGMLFSDIQKTWMRIATMDKEKNPISKKYKRSTAGEKGLGRFACRRLSEILSVISTAETKDGGKEEFYATFNWSSFIPDSDLNRIPVKYFTKPVEADTPTGTTLILGKTTEAWTAWDIKRLNRELVDLVSPLTFNPEFELKETPEEYDPGFHVDFISSEFPTKEDTLDEAFFKYAWAKMSGFVDENGFATYEIGVLNKIINQLEKQYKRDKTFQYLRNVKFEIYIFSYRADLFRHSGWKLNQVRKIGGERGGVKVYADNFRVFGYGREGDDWLRVDHDRSKSTVGVDEEVRDYAQEAKRPGLALFRNDALFGHVVFTRQDNSELEITVNRDRLIDNDAFNELRKFVRLGIDFATVLYANEISKERDIKRLEKEKRIIAEEEARIKVEEERRKAEEEIQKAEERRRFSYERARKAEEYRIRVEIKRRDAEEIRRKAEEKARISGDEQARTEALTAIETELKLLELEKAAIREEAEAKDSAEEERINAENVLNFEYKRLIGAREEFLRIEEEELKRKKDKYEREFSLLRVLASTGTLILIFEHELQALIEDMEDMATNFSFILEKLSNQEQVNYKEILESFSNRTDMIKELGEFLGLTVGAESRLEKRKWVLYPIVESIFRPFKYYFKEFDVHPDNNIPDNLRTPRMFRSELVSVLHNLMSNAFKAVKGEKDRRIEVTGFEDDGIIHIQFLDSGIGIDKSKRETIFEPFESYSEPDLRFGVGTGLGLKIVKDIIRSYGGDVKVIDAPDDWNTCVEITMPREE